MTITETESRGQRSSKPPLRKRMPSWKQQESGAGAAELRRQHARIAELEARVQELGQMARDVNSRRVVELEAQLASISPPEGMAGWTKLRGQRMVLCSLLGDCLPVIDALMQKPGDDDSDARLNGLAGRIIGALNAIAEDQVKGGES